MRDFFVQKKNTCVGYVKLLRFHYAIGTLTQTRMGLGRVTFSSKGPMRSQYVFLMAKYINLYGRFIFPLSFPQTQPLISLRTHERSICFHYGKIRAIYGRFLIHLLFPQTQSLIALNDYAYYFGGYPDSKQNG